MSSLQAHVSCDRCPWWIEDDAETVAEAQSEHAGAHVDAGRPTTFTEFPVEPEKPAVLIDDTHTRISSSR